MSTILKRHLIIPMICTSIFWSLCCYMVSAILSVVYSREIYFYDYKDSVIGLTLMAILIPIILDILLVTTVLKKENTVKINFYVRCAAVLILLISTVIISIYHMNIVLM